MITLNLISPEQKDINHIQYIYGISKKVMFTVLISLVMVGGILIAGQILLQAKLESVTKETSDLTAQIEENKSVNLEKTIKNFNKFLVDLNAIQTEFYPWSQMLIKASSTVPSGVKVSSMNFNKKNSTFIISGNANTRDQLLLFKTNLENSGLFAEIQSPISNILTKENINFEFSGKLLFNANLAK